MPQERAAEEKTWRLLSPADHPLVRAVGRVPAGVHAKLLVAFVGTALLVVVVGLLGLRLLGQSNERVETLGTFQERAFEYGRLRSDAAHVRGLLSENVDGEFYKVLTEGRAHGRGAAGAWPSTRRSRTRSRRSRRPPSPTRSDSCRRPRMRASSPDPGHRRAALGVMQEIIRLSPGRVPASLRDRAEHLAVDLDQLAAELDECHPGADRRGDRPERECVHELAEPVHRRGGGGDRPRAAAGILLSWSLIGPIQRVNSRLAAIASGDFSGHVDVTNRDELGALAANVNRMNDELQRLYKELETASKHKSEFLANMSHELRTPLNAIIGFSQVLREKLSGEINAKQEEYLDDIITSGNHLLALINDILDLSKVEAGQVELEVAPFSLQDALERGVSMVREQATTHGVQVALHTNGGLDVVTGDERRIRQVIFNLLSNAVKFTEGGGLVDVGAAQETGRWRCPSPIRAPASPPRISTGSSRCSSRLRPAPGSTKGPVSVSRCRNASSRCTAAGSGARASSAREARSGSRCP